jgi:hypothetical protein
MHLHNNITLSWGYELKNISDLAQNIGKLRYLLLLHANPHVAL